MWYKEIHMEGLLHLGSSSFLRGLIKGVCDVLKSFEGKRSLVVKLLKLLQCARMFWNFGSWGKLLYALRSPPTQTIQINYVMKEKEHGQLIQVPNDMQQGRVSQKKICQGLRGSVILSDTLRICQLLKE